MKLCHKQLEKLDLLKQLLVSSANFVPICVTIGNNIENPNIEETESTQTCTTGK